jgi:16S rRNA processing protein RimM
MKILVAKILTTHGIKGNLKIKSFSDNEKRFQKGSKLLLDDKEVVVEKSFTQKGNLIIKLEGYDDINEVTKFIGHELMIDEKDLMELKEDEFFVFDLIGLEVFEKDEKKGLVKDVITGVYPNDIYVVERPNKKEVWLPALKNVIKKIDIKNKKIEVENFEDYE